MISRDEVINLAGLARLALQASEVEPLRHDLEAILGYVARLKVEVCDLSAMNKTRSLSDNILRVDTAPHPAGLFTDRLLAMSPAQRNGYLVVKPIFPQDAH